MAQKTNKMQWNLSEKIEYVVCHKTKNDKLFSEWGGFAVEDRHIKATIKRIKERIRTEDWQDDDDVCCIINEEVGEKLS